MDRRAKYPRTWHLAISPGKHRDDRQHRSDDHLVGVEVVVLEKLDGSGVSLHREGVFARSKLATPTHPSYSPLKALHASVAWQLPRRLSVFGEWLHTIHSIRYPDLSVSEELQLFAVRDDERSLWWSWDEVAELADSLGLRSAPVLWRGTFANVEELHERVLATATAPSLFGPDREGVVVRTTAGFADDQFPFRVGKWVREHHVAGERWERFGVRRHQAGERP